MTSLHAYEEDLAYIHDTGFGHAARHAAAELVKQLHAIRIREGLVVDLGCGTGILAEQLTKADFDVLGFDISKEALKFARQRAPQATFQHESFVRAKVPQCVAVAGVGEVFNYIFDSQNDDTTLAKLVRRVYHALAPGGLFLFDLATVGHAPAALPSRTYFVGKDWLCAVTAREDRGRRILTRQITTFRQVGKLYRRSEETHRQRLIGAHQILPILRAAGFVVRMLPGYGDLPLKRGWYGVLARKRVQSRPE